MSSKPVETQAAGAPSEPFDLTVGGVAHGVPCDQGTVRKYDNAGLLDSIRLSDGRRAFPRSTIGKVRQLMREARLAQTRKSG